MTANTLIQWCHHSKSPWHGCGHAALPTAPNTTEHHAPVDVKAQAAKLRALLEKLEEDEPDVPVRVLGTVKEGDDPALVTLAPAEDHPGCLNCYAEANAGRNPGTLGIWGANGTRVKDKTFAKDCRRWDREAEMAGEHHRIFPSICDPFESWPGSILDHQGNELWRRDCGYIVTKHGGHGLPCLRPGCECTGVRLLTMDDLRADLFDVIDECPWLDFLLLTKRPQNVVAMWPGLEEPPRTFERRTNVSLLYSASDQRSFDAGLPHLLACRPLVPVLGLSCEPLTGPISFADLSYWHCRTCGKAGTHEWSVCAEHGPMKFGPGVDWVIVGGESGPGSRPCHLEWIRSIVAQCRGAGVPCFVKQLGSNPIAGRHARNFAPYPCEDKKGGDPAEWPADLRVREFPARYSA